MPKINLVRAKETANCTNIVESNRGLKKDEDISESIHFPSLRWYSYRASQMDGT